jgi:hypothetical protein
MTGATAAMAEFPQIELPQAIRIESRTGNSSALPIIKLTPIMAKTIATIRTTKIRPDAAMVEKLNEAPSSIIATSRSCFAPSAMPACHLVLGSQKVRIAVPARIATTNAST